MRVLLSLGKEDRLERIVIGHGPSRRDGLDEGEYTKKFMMNNFDRLVEFPSLRPLLEALNDEGLEHLRGSISDIVLITEIKNTRHEISGSARIFADRDVEEVDISYVGTTPEQVVVIDPLHRLDQPLTLLRPGLSEVYCRRTTLWMTKIKRPLLS